MGFDAGRMDGSLDFIVGWRAVWCKWMGGWDVPIESLVVAAVQIELSVDRLCYRRGSISVDSRVHIRNNPMN
jgi:hypothetical protein